MKTTILRKVKYQRQRASRAWVWEIPGFVTPIVLHRRHPFWNVPAVTWPRRERDGTVTTCGARIDWNGKPAKAEIRRLLQQVAEQLENV